MADLTYNQGIHGAQDTANAMVRAGRPFHVVTDDWRVGRVPRRRSAAGRARRRRSRAGARSRSRVFGYAMNGMGDIRVDDHALLRALGPQVDALAPGALARAAAAVAGRRRARADRRRGRALRDRPAADAARSARTTRGCSSALERLLRAGGYGAYSTHFDAIAEDGRFARLPLAAASSLMAAGYGFGAEGDALTRGADVGRRRRLLGDTQFTEMYAMDFPSDSILMSHMGEGNWRLAREDRPVRLIKRPLGIGGLDDPPTFLFQYRPGPATLAALVSLGGERFRLLVAEGEVLDADELPALEMPYGRFRPDTGRARLHGRVAAARRPAPPGAQPRPPGRRVARLRRAGRCRVRRPPDPLPDGRSSDAKVHHIRPGRALRGPRRGPGARATGGREGPARRADDPEVELRPARRRHGDRPLRALEREHEGRDPHLRRDHPGALGARPARPRGERHARVPGPGRLHDAAR